MATEPERRLPGDPTLPVPERLLLPHEEDYREFAPPYTPEVFSPEEERILRLFFTNLDQQIYVAKGLPPELIGALCSRYSRTMGSVRRVFLDDYIGPIAFPKKDEKKWEALSADEQADALSLAHEFETVIAFLEQQGSVDTVLNSEKAKLFFKKWLADYGDDSIAELGGTHVLIEGVSGKVTNVIQSGRIGTSYLEKSSRYVEFGDKWPDGEFKFVVPGELKGTPEEAVFVRAMNTLFTLYKEMRPAYREYIDAVHPKGDEETVGSFNASRNAKVFDDTRDLLPFATQTNFAAHGNGRALEGMVTRLLSHPSGEARWAGQMILQELAKVVPGFMERSQTARGAEVVDYRRELRGAKRDIAAEAITRYMSRSDGEIGNEVAAVGETHPRKLAELVDYDPDAEVKIVAELLFTSGNGLSHEEAHRIANEMPIEERSIYLRKVLDVRYMGNPDATREALLRKKPPRETEFADYSFRMRTRGGDLRDLMRHRTLTFLRAPFTTRGGFDIDPDLANSPFADQVMEAFKVAADAYEQILVAHGPDVAEYVVPFGALQEYVIKLNAKALHWMAELRTGPQGRPHYREACQQMAAAVKEVHPALFSALAVDNESYPLARRESEIRKAKKAEAAVI